MAEACKKTIKMWPQIKAGLVMQKCTGDSKTSCLSVNILAICKTRMYWIQPVLCVLLGGIRDKCSNDKCTDNKEN